MKKKLVDGMEYACPMYFVRAGQGWQLRPPARPSRYFADGQYGGVGGAYHAALKCYREVLPVTLQRRPLEASERASKAQPTGIPGVFLCKKQRRGRSHAEYQLQVRVGGLPAQTIYVGMETTWEARYAEKLERARLAREAFVARIQKQRLVPRPISA